MRLRGFLIASIMTLAIVCQCAAQNGAQPASPGNAVDYPEFGFSLTVPRASTRNPVPAPMPGVTADSFLLGEMAIVVSVVKPPAGQTPSAAIEMAIGQLTSKLGAQRTSYLTAQGHEFKGAVGDVKVTAEMAKAHPLAMQAFRAGSSARLCVYAAVPPLAPDRALIIYVGGPSNRSTVVDNVAQSVVKSVTFNTGKAIPSIAAPAASATPTQVLDGKLSLNPGQIALYGEVKSIKDKPKELKMLVDRVVAYEQATVELVPPRDKTVIYAELPKEVKVGSRVVVVGKNTGTGKPITATTIQPEQPKPQK